MRTRRNVISAALQSSLKMMVVTSGLAPLLSTTAKAEIFGSIPEDLPPGQSIYRIVGTVFVDGKKATLDTVVLTTSIIRTEADSEIIFVVGDDAHILRENSELQLEGSSKIATGLKLLTGKILSVFGSRVKDESLSITSSTATIGIRGTGVYVESYPDYTYFCTCYGKTELSTLAGDEQQSYVSTHHDHSKFIYREPQNGQSKIIDAPFINHTDEELALVEALVGRTPPFANFRDSYSGPRLKY